MEEIDNVDLETAKKIIDQNGIVVWVHQMNIDLERMAQLMEISTESIVRITPTEIMSGKYPKELSSYKDHILVCRSGHTSAAMLQILKDTKPTFKLHNLKGGLLSIVSDDYLKTIMHY